MSTSTPPPMPGQPLDYANPYARANMGLGAHAEGDLIVCRPRVELPHRCVFCNEPGTKRLTMKYQWHNPLLYLLILAGVLIYAIVALVVQKKATVTMSVCSLHASRRARKMLIFWLIPLVMLGVAIGAPILESNRIIARNSSIPFVVLGIFGFIIMLVVATQSGRLLKAKFIDDRMAKLAGAGEPFLDSLGEMPIAPPVMVPVAEPVYQ